MVKDLSKKFKDSPYDAAGMPLGCETVDYDKKEDVAKSTVKDKVVEPVTFNDVEYDHSVSEAEWQKRTKFNPALNNTAIQFPGHRIHKKHEEDLATGITEITDPPRKVDLEDPAEGRKELVVDALEKGHKEVSKMPDVAKKEDVDAVINDEHNTDTADNKDLLELLESTDNDGK